MEDPNLLVGFDTNDDAGIYRLTEEIALITTADFITPPVNDPFIFGQIAAANAISDVYAMGGRPVTCLNLAMFPSKKLEPEVLHEIVAGALSKITESGAVLAGGHTIEDDEPKFGLAVTGIVHPKKYWGNRGRKAGRCGPAHKADRKRRPLQCQSQETGLPKCHEGMHQSDHHPQQGGL